MPSETNQFGRPDIPNHELRLAEIPMVGDPFWGVIDEFALTFDGYADHPDDCAELANRAVERYQSNGVLPATLTELRTCLFFEQRRSRHSDGPPDSESLAYIYAVLEAIRSKVKAGDLA